MTPYLHPFACFHCRRSFKRNWKAGVVSRPCPRCGNAAIPLNRKFKPPKSTDLEQWAKVELLVKHGFHFQSLYDSEGNTIAYPKTLNEAKVFIREHSDLAVRLTSA
jgi:hypothetical protein